MPVITEGKTPAKKTRQRPHYYRTKPKVEAQVLELIARGETYRAVKEKTGVGSISTIGNILKRNSTKLRQKKDAYVKLLEKKGLKDNKLAEKAVQLLDAVRLTKYGTEPDNKVQLDTLKYINELKGRTGATGGRAIGVRGEGIEVVISEY